MRFLLYSHDGAGLGHTRRNLAIASSLHALDADANVLVATGLDLPLAANLPNGVDTLKLPGIRKTANDSYEARRLGVPSSEILAIRAELLSAAARSFRPDVLLADKHPLGVGGELRGALGAVRAAGGSAVLGLRDILDSPAAVKREWGRHGLPAVIAGNYNRVLIYGDQHVFDAVGEYDLPSSIAHMTAFCGYLFHPLGARDGPGPPQWLLHRPDDRPVVLATAGGGEDGYALLSAFIDAAVGARWRGVLVAGPQGDSDQRRQLYERAHRARVEFHAFVPNLGSWLAVADAAVCMGGYNTIAEVAATGTPAVCVPRAIPRAEQLIRARAFAGLGLLRCLESDRLTGATLRTEIERVLDWSRPELQARAHLALNFDGGRLAAGELVALAHAGPRPALVPEVAGGRG